MGNVARIAVLLTTMVVCVGCDQVTKSAARLRLDPGKSVSLFHDLVRLQHVENPGAFLSAGDSLPDSVRTILFTFGGIVLVGGAMIWTARARLMSNVQTIGAALICSGGLGNLIDRLTKGGYVTDFLNVGIGPLRTGIFNIADFVLLVGAGIIVLFGASGARTAARDVRRRDPG
jgi:signal peptidase II